MSTNLISQKSDRSFKLWEYQISHGQLLIRSPKAPATETSMETLTNLDLVFLGVEYMAVPRIFRGLELVSPTPDEIQHLEVLLGKAISPDNIIILESKGKRFSIVASSFLISENDWDIFDSPFEFRSHFRGKTLMSASIPLKQEVIEQLPWLLQELGFRIVEDRFDEQSFGNSFVILESSAMRVRLVRDRGQVAAEVASLFDPATWWNLEHVCELISGKNVNPGFELPAVAALLRDNISPLSDYLGPKFSETKLALELRAGERKRAFFSGLS